MKTRTLLLGLIIVMIIGCVAPSPSPVNTLEKIIIAEPDAPPAPEPMATPELMATPEPALTAEEEAYFAIVANTLDAYATTWKTLGILLENADIYSLEWLEDMGMMLGTVQMLNEAIWAIRGPSSCAEIHQHLLSAADYQKQFVEILSQALINADASGIRDAMAKSHSVTMELDKMMDAIEEFKRARGLLE